MSSIPQLSPPSALVCNQLDELRSASRRGRVLDLACGRGRHSLFLAKAGIPVVGLDRNPNHLKEIEARARDGGLPLSAVRCDLETEHGIPVLANSCGAILVFRFLYRPLAPAIERALQPGGILLYETFTRAHRKAGVGPRRSEFYLEPDELPALFPNLERVFYQEGPDGYQEGPDDYQEGPDGCQEGPDGTGTEGSDDLAARLVARRPF